MNERVSIIILNWNGWYDTIECLESIYRINYTNYDVIVVDNGSSDNSVEKIKSYAKGKLEVDSKFFKYNPLNKPIRVFEITEDDAKTGKFNKPLYEKYDSNRRLILIRNKKNYGYAGGNNIGVKFALTVLNPDYILILNNDTIVHPRFLDRLVTKAKENNCGLASPIVLYYDRPSIVHNVGSIIVPVIGYHIKLCHNKELKECPECIFPEFLEGSALLVHSLIFLDDGLFDESFFCYWEETELEMRARKKGYNLCSFSIAKVWHKIAVSSGGNKSEFYIYHYTRNRIWFFKRHFNNLLAAHILASLVFEMPFRILQLRSTGKLTAYLKGLKDGIFNKNMKFKHVEK